MRLLERTRSLEAEERKRVVDERVAEAVGGEQDLVYGVDRLQELRGRNLRRHISILYCADFPLAKILTLPSSSNGYVERNWGSSPPL